MNERQSDMMTMRPVYLLFFALLQTSAGVWAETIYVDDKLMVGLHQDKTTDSAILKLIPAGTALEVIKQDKSLTQVRAPDGAIGWVDNKYLIKTAPGRAQLQEAREKITQLEAEIAELKATGGVVNPVTANPELAKENEELKQLLKSERLRIGELQAQTAELKNKLAQGSNNEQSASRLEKLTRENAELQQQIKSLQAAANSPAKNINIDMGEFNWEKLLIAVAISLIVGFAAGIYVLDLIIRRRHGGFRI